MTGLVARKHDFQDPEYARDWSNQFVPSPSRLILFDAIIDRLCEQVLPRSHIVELGIGPGFLAERLLSRLPDVTYEGVDFSGPMLQLAAERLSPYVARLILTRADLTSSDWTARLTHPIGAFVSTWTLHDLGGQIQTAKVYRDCHRHLATDGILLNGDFVKPSGARLEFEEGRFTVDRHLDLLKAAGFHDPRCILFLEHEINNPSTSQNCVCLEALV